MTKIKEKELVILIAKLEKENEIIKKLSTRKGFYEYYFDLLKTSKTQIQAFNKVNKLYSTLFGVKRYSNFVDFKKLTTVWNIA